MINRISIPLILCLAFALSTSGCERYNRMPLSNAAIDRTLESPMDADLHVESNSIGHPLLPKITVDPSDGLTPDEAAILSVLINPTLRAERDQRNLADAQMIQAGLFPNPQFTWSVDDPIGGMTEGTVKGTLWGLDWSLRELATRRTRLSEAQSNRSSINTEVLWKEWQVSQAAKLAAYQQVSLNQKAMTAEDNRNRLDDNLRRVTQAVESGFMTEQDLAAAETASSQAKSRYLELKKQAGNQRLKLNEALGIPPDAGVRVQDDVELPYRLDPPTLNQVESGLEDRRLDLVAFRKGYESQEAAVQQAILEQFPNVSVGFNRAKDTGDVVTRGFGITFDIPIFDRNQGGIATEKANRQILYDEYIQRIFEARATIAALIHNATSLNEQIESVQEEIPRFRRLVDTYREAVDRGQADILNYYNAWNDLTDKKIELIDLKQALAETRIALEIASGTAHLDEITDSPAKTWDQNGEVGS
ncbi:MAG: TolC family protein [Candidatus Omnitrophica bacterium]|nr:TolC family protein [Candidatus Omnitrophota bacterium]